MHKYGKMPNGLGPRLAKSIQRYFCPTASKPLPRVSTRSTTIITPAHSRLTKCCKLTALAQPDAGMGTSLRVSAVLLG